MQSEHVEQPLWDDKDVADYLRVSVWTVKRLRRSGKLPAFYIGTQARYEPAEVRAALTAQRKAKP